MNPISSELGFLIQCRPGFESEVASEIKFLLKTECQILCHDGFVVIQAPALVPNLTNLLAKQVFARQTHFLLGKVKQLPERNRAQFLAESTWKLLIDSTQQETPLLTENDVNQDGDALIEMPLELEHVDFPDTNEGKTLSKFAQTFRPHFEKALLGSWKNLSSASRQAVRAKLRVINAGLDDSLSMKLALFLDNWSEVSVCCALKTVTHSDAMGIPRLKSPKDAPSRSTLKLEEAFHVFLSQHRREQLLNKSMRAIDLGASPGGWTYQFVTRGISVVAVDNGKMDPKLMETGLVTHIQQDGFVYMPKKAVDWMVCDVVDKPIKIVDLVLKWAEAKKAKQFIFNLKFPMKKRFEELQRCEHKLKRGLEGLSQNYYLKTRHLYFDRDEVTCYLNLTEANDRAK